ncbi:hypothetical protein HZ326_10870 [Fusarium oxysporum f. sp. albedinis]|nr:hypothetical protein HZ326_10870 [Fusarium oxysporum f. sp. albedinis]
MDVDVKTNDDDGLRLLELTDTPTASSCHSPGCSPLLQAKVINEPVLSFNTRALVDRQPRLGRGETPCCRLQTYVPES